MHSSESLRCIQAFLCSGRGVVRFASPCHKQITQLYWGAPRYVLARRLGINLKITYNSSRSGMRPDVNPNDAAKLGNATLISQGVFDPVMFSAALNNLNFAATQISGVIVPQWIGQGKVYFTTCSHENLKADPPSTTAVTAITGTRT